MQNHNIEFQPWPKTPRLKRNIVITEKLDGTNAQVYIDDDHVLAGSRNRWVTPDSDNYGFARWVDTNKDILREALGPGRHFGEWWGNGIQRTYGLKEKRFSLFNTSRWSSVELPDILSVVPILYTGILCDDALNAVVTKLRDEGSVAAPGFMNPEGIIVYHTTLRTNSKILLENDESPKGE